MDEIKVDTIFKGKNIIIRNINDFHSIYNLLLSVGYEWVVDEKYNSKNEILDEVIKHINKGELVLTPAHAKGMNMKLSFWGSLIDFNEYALNEVAIEYSAIRDLDKDSMILWFKLQ